MVGARIEYSHAHPYGFSKIIATGTIDDMYEDKHGVLHIHVKPDACHLCPKWRTENDLIRYLPGQGIGGIEKAVAAA